jgi:hypothetical protein
MAFYAILACFIGPLIGYYLIGKTITNAGNGFIAGSLLSILLWVTVGSKMVNK